MDPTIQLLQIPTTAARPAGGALPLQVGQVLAAIAARTADGQVLLSIAGQSVPARTTLPLAPGQALRLEVVSLQPQVVLRMLPEPRAADPLQAARAEALPRQGGLAPFLATALQAAARSDPAGGGWPAALQRLLAQLPERALLSSATGLRRALADSGLFLETRLASGQPPPEGDLKGQLLRLLQSLPEGAAEARPAPNAPPPPRGHASPSPQPATSLPEGETEALAGALKQQTEGALARLTLHQLATTEAHREGEARWLLELPVRTNGEVVPLRIAREDGHPGQEGEAPRWSVQLALDLPGLGPLHARVSLQGERVGTLFWAEQEETRELVAEHLAELRERLEAQGLAVSALNCLPGQPPADPAPGGAAPLLDERA